MPKVLLRLVTLQHPKDYLSDIDKILPLNRSRAEQSLKVERLAEEEGFELAYRPDGDAVLPDTGRQTPRFAEKVIDGSALAPYLIAPYLSAPRYVYTRDEPSPRPKRKLEFRRSWSTEEGSLNEVHKEQLLDSIRKSHFKIKGLWVNPSRKTPVMEPEWAQFPIWANLVIGPVSNRNAFARASLTFSTAGGRVFIVWDEL